VSLDALLIIAPSRYVDEILGCIRNKGVAIDIVGEVKEGKGTELIVGGEIRDFTPRFRESAYTPIKKLVSEKTPRNFEAMKRAVDKVAAQAVERKRRVVARLSRK
jgi:hydrogenase expression/formation protein